jgi:2-hydroxychromene-2-carboxylate isomerase
LKQVEFFLDVGSPTTYLAWTQLPGICKRLDAQLIYRPMLLGGVFQATGNSTPASVAAKGRHMNRDMERFARRYGVPLAINPFFPINTLFLMRVITGVQMRVPERFDAILSGVFRRMWVEPENLNDPAITAQALSEAGFDPAQMQALSADAEVKARLRATTEEAVARGAYGAPTMFIGNEMFFGQDRLDFIEEELARANA